MCQFLLLPHVTHMSAGLETWQEHLQCAPLHLAAANALVGGALQGGQGAAAGAAARGWRGGLRRHRSGSCMTQLQGKHVHSEGSDGCAAR